MILTFKEPHLTGGIATVEVSADKAIEYQKLRKPGLYSSDKKALDDFIIIHWATIKLEEGDNKNGNS